MNCREFKSKHVGFVDDVLSAADMEAMRRHTAACPGCSRLDIRVRRSLMVVRNLPQIAPSDDFFFRLSVRLREAPAPVANRSPVNATMVVVAAALAAAFYFAMAGGPHSDSLTSSPSAPVTAHVSTEPGTLTTAMVPPVSAGVPVWPAMFMVGELPMHLANVELSEMSLGR